MKNRWSDEEAARFVELHGPEHGEDLALRLYTARLIGSEESLVLHGGGNTSVKTRFTNRLGEPVAAIHVKGSGRDLRFIEPEGHPALDLESLRRLRSLAGLSDEEMVNELRIRLFRADAPTPSIESLVHAFLPPKYVDHTHADAILALTNRDDGEETVRRALGDDVLVLGYHPPGLALARASADVFDSSPRARGIVWMRHGIVTWGETARQAYEGMIELVTRAERFLADEAARGETRSGLRPPAAATSPEAATERWRRLAPVVRGLVALPSGDPDRPWHRRILSPLADRETLAFLDSPGSKAIARTPPITADHLIRTKPWPLWLDDPDLADGARFREQLAAAIARYSTEYEAYLARHRGEGAAEALPADPRPRVILVPGLGAVCVGRDAREARIARDITARSLAVKRHLGAAYRGLEEGHLFEMEHRAMQQAKLERPDRPLRGCVAAVTGAAGAIGAGICRVLAEHGAHVAATDLAGERLDGLVAELEKAHEGRILGTAMDVTDSDSIAAAFREIASAWGGVDLVVPNAGVAHVASLAEMKPEDFRRVERVNIEGTLLVLAEAARHFEEQGTGGDIVLVSTKNVFAPGAKFGAYSATKAAAHQLARIASLELAPLDVRVNMVAPDAVFSEGERTSGLWDLVGPDRMRARGLDREQLEEYYRNRNLLKARVTATHVANAVLYFATRQSPTTGATIPVDGGLPDATPR
jgi:rhamnose utilization protein RhaD (predicted bifunctional aldolase and dehydrogenase)/NAD(P)-dependent dehydrogenase (short-subunit alcohol dehydrogenase family)